MDPTILQFLVGAIGGIGVALAGSHKSSSRRKRNSKRKRMTSLQRTGDRRRLSINTSGTVRSAAALSAEKLEEDDHHLTRLPNSTSTSPSIPLNAVSAPSSIKLSTISVCPACGLEASDSLLSEHFQSSPSHPYGKQKKVGMEESDSTGKTRESSTLDEHHSVLRNLLSLLVPPRAFGRRHLQQAESESDLPAFARPITRASGVGSIGRIILPIDN